MWLLFLSCVHHDSQPWCCGYDDRQHQCAPTMSPWHGGNSTLYLEARMHVGVHKSLYIVMHLCISRHLKSLNVRAPSENRFRACCKEPGRSALTWISRPARIFLARFTFLQILSACWLVVDYAMNFITLRISAWSALNCSMTSHEKQPSGVWIYSYVNWWPSLSHVGQLWVGPLADLTFLPLLFSFLASYLQICHFRLFLLQDGNSSSFNPPLFAIVLMFVIVRLPSVLASHLHL